MEAGIEAAPALRPEPAAGRKVLFSAMKNEAPFLLEWVAYHKAIGFDEIVICSNPSTDGTEEILAALASAGEIRHLRADPPQDQSPQGVASRVFTDEVGYRDGDWYLWLDADEFLNIHVGDRTVSALIDRLGTRQLFLINWRIFGSSGNKTFPGRFIDPAFSRASEPSFKGNREIKTFFCKTDQVLGFAPVGIHRPLIRRNSEFTLDAVLSGAGHAPSADHRPNRRWVAGRDYASSSIAAPEDIGWVFAQINHYIVRTPEFFGLKGLRGRGWKGSNVAKPTARHTPDFFQAHDRNEAEDRSILYWQDRVTEEIDRLLHVPAVAASVHRSQELVGKLLAEIEATQANENAVPKVRKVTVPPASGFQISMPDAETAVLRQSYAQAHCILEYGSGGSTQLAAELGKQVTSVESDRDWAERLSAHLAGLSAQARVHHVDIGPTKDWGRPSDASGAARYHLYALSVWDRDDLGEPDLVLIDGRFRAACLAAVMLRARRPTTVLFDDYAPRHYYHGVEKLARKDEMVGRMARFTVTPGPIPPEMLTQVIGWFSDPR